MVTLIKPLTSALQSYDIMKPGGTVSSVFAHKKCVPVRYHSVDPTHDWIMDASSESHRVTRTPPSPRHKYLQKYKLGNRNCKIDRYVIRIKINVALAGAHRRQISSPDALI